MNRETIWQQNYLKRTRLKAKAYLGERCAHCGVADNLDFDHIDPTTKSFSIAVGIAKHLAWDRLVLELDKCQLLCKPCHVLKTRTDYGYEGVSVKVLECPNCLKTFDRRSNKIGGKLTFCSRSCSSKYYAKIRSDTAAAERTSLTC